jgi:hypothetical protein
LQYWYYNYLCTYNLYSPVHNVLDACILHIHYEGLGPGNWEYFGPLGNGIEPIGKSIWGPKNSFSKFQALKNDFLWLFVAAYPEPGCTGSGSWRQHGWIHTAVCWLIQFATKLILSRWGRYMLTLLYLLCLYSQSCFFSPALGEKIRFLFALSDSFSLSLIRPLYICTVFLGNRFV